MQVTAAVSQTASTATPTSAAMTAVVPAAGLGTRLRPLTDALPKEMLPVGRRTALERIVDELAAAGVRRTVFVLSPAKEALIRRRFGDSDPASGMEFAYVLQTEMRGLGDAVLCAEALVRERPVAPFLVALGDAVFEEPSPGGIVRRLIAETAARDAAVGIVVRRVERALLRRYGVVKPAGAAPPDGAAGAAAFAIADIVEKPAPEDAPSDFAASARYLVAPAIFDVLRSTAPARNGEIEFTDAMRSLLASGRGGGVAVPLATGERRHDLGDLAAYFQAFATFALDDPECGEALQRYLRERIGGSGCHGTEQMPTRKEVVVE